MLHNGHFSAVWSDSVHMNQYDTNDSNWVKGNSWPLLVNKWSSHDLATKGFCSVPWRLIQINTNWKSKNLLCPVSNMLVPAVIWYTTISLTSNLQTLRHNLQQYLQNKTTLSHMTSYSVTGSVSAWGQRSTQRCDQSQRCLSVWKAHR